MVFASLCLLIHNLLDMLYSQIMRLDLLNLSIVLKDKELDLKSLLDNSDHMGICYL